MDKVLIYTLVIANMQVFGWPISGTRLRQIFDILRIQYFHATFDYLGVPAKFIHTYQFILQVILEGNQYKTLICL